MTRRLVVGPVETEAQWQAVVVGLARFHGWRVHHGRPMRDDKGRVRTPITGDRGFFDLVLMRRERVVLVELKSATGKLGPGQPEWLELGRAAANAAGNVQCFVWRPADWAEVQEVLR